MINPYEAPPEVRRGPLLKRLRRAMSLAATEFRTGLKRDAMTSRDVVKACVCGLAFLVVVSMLGLYFGAAILSSYGWF